MGTRFEIGVGLVLTALGSLGVINGRWVSIFLLVFGVALIVHATYEWWRKRHLAKVDNAAKTDITSLGQSKPPQNRDTLIADFTELGDRAEDLINQQRVYIDRRKQHGAERDYSWLRQQTERATEAYKEANLEVNKQRAIAGGKWSVKMAVYQWKIKFVIDGNTESLEKGEFDLDSDHVINGIVQKAIGTIRGTAPKL